jgi:flagellar biosynthesis protein FliR
MQSLWRTHVRTHVLVLTVLVRIGGMLEAVPGLDDKKVRTSF